MYHLSSAAALLLLLLAIVTCALACDTQKEIDAMSQLLPQLHDGRGGMDLPKPLVTVPPTLLPQTEGNESPACLDGSRYGYYFVPSASGKSKKWTISISGGGWCYNETLCLQRANTTLGSSKNWVNAGCGCMNVRDDALDTDVDPIDHDCNCLYMPYGDGASFSGFRTDPWPVPSAPGKSLYFRGIKNFDATVEAALTLGLKNAVELVLTGGSAGGLSTFLHVDRLADRMAKVNPNCRVTGAPVVGFFLDHDNAKKDANNYTEWMKYIHHMQNLTFGSDGGLEKACSTLFPKDPHYCFMSPHMQSVVKTPFFVFNSKYDSWQLANELQVSASGGFNGSQAEVLAYGKDFDAQFDVVTTEAQNGAFITSCICHGCPWSTLTLDGGDVKNAYQRYASWYVKNGTNHFHHDGRGPNGDGTIKSTACSPFTPK